MRRLLLALTFALSVAAGSYAQEGVVRAAGPRWPFRDGDRLYWFGASHTSIGFYCSAVEFYVRTRFPDMKIVSMHCSRPPNLDVWNVRTAVAERKPTLVFPEGGFYDTHNPQKFVADARAVYDACTNVGARCIFLPTMWLGENLKHAPPEFAEKDADIAEVTARLLAAKKVTPWSFNLPAQITPPYYRNKGALEIDGTMAALKAWGATNGVHVLSTYDEVAAWAKARWAKDPAFWLGSPHYIPAGYILVGIYALESLDAPIFESRLELEWANGRAGVRKAVNCAVSEVAATNGVLTFRRVDKVLPVLPPVPASDIPADAAPTLQQAPYFLAIAGLAAGDYALSIEGATLGTASAEELAAGVNLNKVYLRGAAGRRAPEVPWLKLWEACRGNTMDKDYQPVENGKIGHAAWEWAVKPAAPKGFAAAAKGSAAGGR